MKCVHCNGEHPDGFKFCPVTGKEIVQPFKACTNPECVDFNKHILPPDALFCPRCGQKIDKIGAEYEGESYNYDNRHTKSDNNDIVCPRCGSTEVRNLSVDNEYEYKCLDCELVWDGSKDSQYARGKIMEFMPIDGITLGRTTVEDVDYMFGEDARDEDGNIFFRTSEGGFFFKNCSSYYIDEYILNYPKPIPDRLKSLGFDWQYGPGYYVELFKSMEFTVFKYDKTVMRLYAFADDGSIGVTLQYGGHPNRKERTKDELVKISIDSNPYMIASDLEHYKKNYLAL